MMIDWLLRQSASRTLAVILLKTLPLFSGVGELMKTISQLNAFVIDLETFRYAMIFGADLRQ